MCWAIGMVALSVAWSLAIGRVDSPAGRHGGPETAPPHRQLATIRSARAGKKRLLRKPSSRTSARSSTGCLAASCGLGQNASAILRGCFSPGWEGEQVTKQRQLALFLMRKTLSKEDLRCGWVLRAPGLNVQHLLQSEAQPQIGLLPYANARRLAAANL